MTIAIIISTILAAIATAIGAWKLGRRGRQSQTTTPMAKANTPKGIQATLDKQDVPLKPKKLPLPEQLTKEELEALAEEE